MNYKSSNNKSLVIKETTNCGVGVYAVDNIKMGEVIHILNGETISLKEVVNKINSGVEYIDDPLQVGKRTYIDLDKFSRSFNHSCKPNAGIRKRSELFALVDINNGQEITYDYSTTIAPTVWEMECKCNNDICRKTIGDILSVPKERIEYYIKSGAFQFYIKSILNEVHKGGGV